MGVTASNKDCLPVKRQLWWVYTEGGGGGGARVDGSACCCENSGKCFSVWGSSLKIVLRVVLLSWNIHIHWLYLKETETGQLSAEVAGNICSNNSFILSPVVSTRTARTLAVGAPARAPLFLFCFSFFISCGLVGWWWPTGERARGRLHGTGVFTRCAQSRAELRVNALKTVSLHERALHASLICCLCFHIWAAVVKKCRSVSPVITCSACFPPAFEHDVLEWWKRSTLIGWLCLFIIGFGHIYY